MFTRLNRLAFTTVSVLALIVGSAASASAMLPLPPGGGADPKNVPAGAPAPGPSSLGAGGSFPVSTMLLIATAIVLAAVIAFLVVRIHRGAQHHAVA